MKRMGWVKRNISDPETIAGHMYRMAMLSFLVDGKENLDKTKWDIYYYLLLLIFLYNSKFCNCFLKLNNLIIILIYIKCVN